MTRVEVFPVAPDRWILVFDGYSSECGAAREVPDAAREASGYFGRPSDKLHLVDDLGAPWSVATAAAQARRLGIDWHPPRLRDRLVRRAGSPRCPVCDHEWSAHPPHHRACATCGADLAGATPTPETDRACDVRRPSNAEMAEGIE